jgi:hypothetical protein
MEMMDGDTKEGLGAVPVTSLWGAASNDPAAAAAPAADPVAAAAPAAPAQSMSAVPATSLGASLSEAATGNTIAALAPPPPQQQVQQEEPSFPLPAI